MSAPRPSAPRPSAPRAPLALRSPSAFRGLALLVAVGATVAVALPAAPASADGRRSAVPSVAPAWATASADRGAAASTDQVDVEVALDLQDEQGAVDLATAVSTPGSPQYRQPLAPADWIARFAPTQDQVDALTTAATAAGLSVKAVPASRLFVLLDGTVSGVDAFFATRVHQYAVAGSTRFAAATTVSLPGRVAAGVAGVAFDHPRITSRLVTPAAKTASTRCSTWWGQRTVRIPRTAGTTKAATPVCGASAKQVRALYDLNGAGLDGSGQTVAVVDAFGSTTMRADLATYSARNGLPAADYTEVVPARSTWADDSCDPSGWATEQTMDLEAVHAVAPRARLVYVGAADCGTGFDVAMSQVLDQGLATIVSNSWGSTALDGLAAGPLQDDDATAAGITVDLHQHLQAAAQGVGLYFASGDAGDDAAVVGRTAVDFPASSPWVTAVGGTAAALDRRGKRAFSTAWGTNVAVAKAGRWALKPPGTFAGGSGGGRSDLFDAVAWQRDVVPGTVSQGTRTLPDVSALAAPETGMLVGQRTGGTYRTLVAGGTSLAAPIVAGQVALAQQAAGRPLGFLNPALYAAAARGAVRDVAPSAAHRVAQAATGGLVVRTFDRDSSLSVRRGYDLATGVGELTARSLRAIAAG